MTLKSTVYGFEEMEPKAEIKKLFIAIGIVAAMILTFLIIGTVKNIKKINAIEQSKSQLSRELPGLKNVWPARSQHFNYP